MDKQNQFNAQQHPDQSVSNQPVNPLEDKELSPSLPKGWHRSQNHSLNGWIYLLEGAEQRSQFLLPLLGYGLLVFALFDYIYINRDS